MKIVRDKQSGYWKILTRNREGKPVRVSTGTRDHQEAVDIARGSGVEQLENSIQSATLTRKVLASLYTAKRLSDAIEAWVEWMPHSNISPRTAAHNRDHALRFCQAVGGKLVYTITEREISQWVNDPTNGNKRGTRVCKLAALRSLFDYCTIRGWCDHNCAKLVRVRMEGLTHEQKTTRKTEAFTEEELQRVIDATEPWSFWRAAVVISRETGLRLGDICQLEWAAVDEGAVWMDKTDRRISIEFTPRCLKVLQRIPRVGRYCFPDQRLLINDDTRRASLSMQFRRLLDRVGIEGKSFHGIRATYARSINAPIETVAERLGHQNTKTTERYL